MKNENPISPQVEEILSRCCDNAERIRIARRLEAIAAELWAQVFDDKKPDAMLPPFRRN
jgi:lambda repressor-like predicted transcriptional regulator